MAHDYRCWECGAYLDPGEKCTCRAEREIKESELRELFSEGSGGQMEMEVGNGKD